MPSSMIHLLAARKHFAQGTAAYFTGTLAPDAVGERAFKDALHFRDCPQRLAALADWVRAHDMADPFEYGFALHLYVDVLWDHGPQATFRAQYEDDAWFRPYRHAIDVASCWCYHHEPWAPSCWDQMASFCAALPRGVYCGIPAQALEDAVCRNRLWHRQHAPASSGYYTPALMEAFTADAAEDFAGWIDGITEGCRLYPHCR